MTDRLHSATESIIAELSARFPDGFAASEVLVRLLGRVEVQSVDARAWAQQALQAQLRGEPAPPAPSTVSATLERIIEQLVAATVQAWKDNMARHA